MATGLVIKHKRELRLVHKIAWLIVVALVAAVAWFGFKWYNSGYIPSIVSAKELRADSRVNQTPTSATQIASYTVPSTHPRYISIPKLQLNETRVLPTGLDSNNLIPFPTTIADATWFDKTVTPGTGYGAELIVAHNQGVRRNGAFVGLSSLKFGDTIHLQRGDGKQFTYNVIENYETSLSELTANGMKKLLASAKPDAEGLNLMTTSGAWVPRLKQFDHRTIVRAVLAP